MRLSSFQLWGKERGLTNRLEIEPTWFRGRKFVRYRVEAIIKSLSNAFESRTETGIEHFACQDSDLSQTFKLTFSSSQKILKNVNVVV